MFSDYEKVRHMNCLIKPASDYYKWFCQQVHGLENHHALADAEACAWIARGIL